MARLAQPIQATDFVGAVRAEIRRRRLEKFSSAAAAASSAGVPTITWAQWESRGVTLAALPTIAEVLGCTPAELLPAKAPPRKTAKAKKTR